MTKLKTKITLESSDMFDIPINISKSLTVSGSGNGQSYNKTQTTTYAVGTNPTALPVGALDSTDKRAYIYIRNKSSVVGEIVSLYIQIAGPAYHKIGMLEPAEFLYMPFANIEYIYADAVEGTPELEFLILEK
tara:strand:- start:1892 stop:2290 length:399 start_codon:yes stop_codon:yes gene_type:complete